MTHAGDVCLLHPPGYTHRPASWDVEVHHVWSVGTGGPDVPANELDSCPTGHSNVHALVRLALRASGVDSLPWDLRRRFTFEERHYARLGHLATVGDLEVRALLSNLVRIRPPGPLDGW